MKCLFRWEQSCCWSVWCKLHKTHRRLQSQRASLQKEVPNEKWVCLCGSHSSSHCSAPFFESCKWYQHAHFLFRRGNERFGSRLEELVLQRGNLCRKRFPKCPHKLRVCLFSSCAYMQLVTWIQIALHPPGFRAVFLADQICTSRVIDCFAKIQPCNYLLQLRKCSTPGSETDCEEVLVIISPKPMQP